MTDVKYPITFTGAGPGDPELITVKGKRSLEEADLVIFAGSLVPEELLVWTREECECLSSASMDLDGMVEKMAEGYRAGKKVVRLHTGDPSSTAPSTNRCGTSISWMCPIPSSPVSPQPSELPPP